MSKMSLDAWENLLNQHIAILNTNSYLEDRVKSLEAQVTILLEALEALEACTERQK